MNQTKKYLRAMLFGATLGAGFLSLSVSTPTALAQTSKGTLTGVVRDTTGAVIAGAEITITNVETGEVRKGTSSSLGAYRLDAMTPGHYTLKVQSSGFESYSAKGINVTPSQTVSFDATLKPGQVGETVEVTADEVLLDQENASLSATISQQEMAKLPIFTLNPVETLTTIPGVQVVSNSSMSNGQAIQVSGARPRSNNFMIDGQEINDASIGGQAVQPNIPDMYSDTVIYTHNAPAEFGRASGGVVNMITKGGTNQFHGSAWELYSGSGLDSLDGQSRLTAKSREDKARWNQHQYGFTAGGPALKNKLFGFGAVQYTRFYGNGTWSPVTLPTQNGINTIQQIANGTNSTTSTQAKLLLGYLSNASYLKTFSPGTSAPTSYLGAACPTYDATNSPSLTLCSVEAGHFQRPKSAEANPDTQWTYRVDYTPSSRDTFSARYLHDRNSLTPDFGNNGAALPGFESQQGGPSELGQGAWTHIFSEHLVNEFRAAETRIAFAFAPTPQALANPLYANPTVNISNISTLGFAHSSFPQGRSQDMYQFQDTVSWTLGRHTMRIGADIGRRIEMDLNAINSWGTLTFAKGGSGNSSMGNFLLNQTGPSGSVTRTFGNPRVDPHSWRSGIFAQDDIKVSPELTVNLGIRWDYFTNPDNSLAFPAIDPSSATNLYGPIQSRFTVSDNKHSFAPRVGFAYTPRFGGWFGDGKSVIRAGFGIFFDSEFTNITVNTAASAPNVASGTLTQTTGNGLANATGQIANITPTISQLSSVTSVVKDMTTPYTPEWNLTVERELPGKIGVSVTYAGARGIKLFANQQYNYFDINTGKRLNPTRGAIVGRGNFADSLYNGLEIGARRNFSHGLSINGSYVYSKTLDDGSEVFTTDSAPTSYTANLAPGGRKQDWGNSAYDHRHYASFTYILSPDAVKVGEKFQKVSNAVTGHWTLSGTTRLQTGAYSTVNVAGFDLNGDGSTTNDRPVPGGNKHAGMDSVAVDGYWLGGTVGQYYDLAANNETGAMTVVNTSNTRWVIPAKSASFLHNEIGRNSYLNPGLITSDIALEKAIPASFHVAEKGQFVLRCEAQNFSNHNNVNLPDVNLLDAGTAAFLNTADARSSSSRALRFWAKYTF